MTQATNGPAQQPNQSLADPFAQIFVDRADANWAFDFLLATVKQLGITAPYDERFALTLTRRDGKPELHLSFGGWLVVGFGGPGAGDRRVALTLLADRVAWDERLAAFPFTRKEGAPEVRTYHLPLAMVQPMTSDLEAALNATLTFITAKFQHWKRPPAWKRHNPEIIEALFDRDKRAQLFAGQLANTELRYERHLTAFYQDVSEEGEAYEAEPKPNPPYPLPQLAEETGFDEAELARWVRAIERKGQAILYGPPGTGKTFIAEKLAEHLVGGGDGFWDLVQFHPAYAYEDFIQGIRPHTNADGSLSYPLVPGRFLEFCRQAKARQDTCVLILDEINRANLARVFGELMYLLEYRDRKIPLAGGGTLQIPDNMRLIGTMNTADRSIALVDHALRRRFAFLALYPKPEVLRRYHEREQTGFAVEGLIGVLQRLNRKINDPHYAVGITFFLRHELAAQIEDIWQMEIEPYLEEYFFDRRGEVDAWRWAKIAREIMPA
jgi:5-methylcytosine-specific restriction protein B